MNKQKVILEPYTGNQVKQMTQAGVRVVRFDIPMNIKCIRLSAFLNKTNGKNEEIFAFLKTVKKYRIVLEEL